MFRMTMIGLAAAMMFGGAHAATDYPSGYTKCAQNTGATCTMTGTRSVALGKSGSFVYATKTGSFACTGSAFPSNSFTTSAWCSYAGSTTSSSSSVASSSSSSKASSSAASSSSSSTTTSGSCKAGATISTTVDCGGATVGTSCDGGSESQAPVFTLTNGGHLKNVVIKSGAAADGIHCISGTCTLTNVTWPGVCEDAATLRAEATGGTLNIIGGSATNADDKTFQHNAIKGTINISNFTTTGSIGKLVRSCGDCTGNGGPRYINVNGAKLEKVSGGAVVGINSNYGDVATIKNLQIKGYKSGSPKVCVTYKGVVKGNGSSSSIGEEWNTANCKVTTADVTAY